MESQLVRPQQGHSHAHEVDPHSAELRTVIEGEEKHRDEKPAVLRKVKDKVKKIKNKIGIKKHDDGHDRESGSSSEEEVEEEDDDPIISSAPTSVAQRVSIGDSEKVEPEKERLGDFTGDVKEDPAAPRSTNPPARGGEEIGMTPFIQRFESITVTNEPRAELEPNEPKTGLEPNEPKTQLETKPETQLPDSTGSTDQSNVSYTEKLKSMATVPAEYGKNIASTVYDRLSNAGTAVVQRIRGGPTKKDDTETSREVNQDKGVSVKEYISEKLKPGEEDQALSEVISEVVQRNKEEIGNKAKENMATAQTRTTTGGVRIAEKVRGAMTSVVGGSKGSDDATSVASDQHQEKGSDEAAEPMKLD